VNRIGILAAASVYAAAVIAAAFAGLGVDPRHVGGGPGTGVSLSLGRKGVGRGRVMIHR
jgi:hypothetical protein